MTILFEMVAAPNTTKPISIMMMDNSGVNSLWKVTNQPIQQRIET